MKRAFLIPGAVMSVVFCIGAGAADWAWHGAVGATCWFPEWSHDLQGFDADTSGLAGPVAFLHYGNFGLGIQYYTGSFDVGFSGLDSNLKAHRDDLDLMLSYRLTRVFQVSILYKEIRFDWKQVARLETEIRGLGAGGGINYMFDNQVLVYGYGFYMPDLDYSQHLSGSGEISFDSDGLWLEGGAGYLLKKLHLLAKAGYRYQKISAESGDHSWSETTRGPRFEISYYF